MARDTEDELGQENPEPASEPSRDRPAESWQATVERLVERRERNEVAALAAALNPARTTFRRIATELRGRAQSIRSKWGARFTKGLELEILGELDAIGAEAEELEARRLAGTLTEKQETAAWRRLDPLVFAVRVRFEALGRMQDLPFCRQARQPEPGERQRELDQINEFLARKNAREAA